MTDENDLRALADEVAAMAATASRAITPAAVMSAHPRRRRSRNVVRVAAALFAVGIVSSAVVVDVTSHGGRHSAAAGSTIPPSGSPAGGVFYAAMSNQNGYWIEELSALTGRQIRRLMTITSVPNLTVWKPTSGPDGSIWFSVATGPVPQNDSAGGDPRPDSCTGEVIQLNPATGARIVVLRTPRSAWLGSVAASPDGHYFAYQTAPCATSYFNAHLVVADRETHKQWDVATGMRVCHDLSAPAWAPGPELVLGYGPASDSGNGGVAPGTLGKGVCTDTRPDKLVFASVLVGAPPTVGVSAPVGCEYSSGVADAWGFVAIERCGDNFLGHAALIQFNARLAVRGQWSLPPGANPATLAANASGRRVLVDEEQDGSLPHSADRIFVFDGRSLHQVAQTTTAQFIGACW